MRMSPLVLLWILGASAGCGDLIGAPDDGAEPGLGELTAAAVVPGIVGLSSSGLQTDAMFAVDGDLATATIPNNVVGNCYLNQNGEFLRLNAGYCQHLPTGTQFYGWEAAGYRIGSNVASVDVQLTQDQTGAGSPAAQTQIFTSWDALHWTLQAPVTATSSLTTTTFQLVPPTPTSTLINVMLGKSIAAAAPPAGPTLRWHELSFVTHVPPPSISLTVGTTAVDVHWGNTASYPVTVSASNGFSGTVTLRAGTLPHGATAAPVTLTVPANGTASTTFTVATASADTLLGASSFSLSASAPGVTTRSRTLTLHVLPTEGPFGSLSWVTGSTTCGAVQAVVGASAQGPAVHFVGPTFTSSSVPFLYYAFTPGCRGAVSYGAGPSVQLWNLGFHDDIADRPGTQTTNFGGGGWDQTRFRISPDGSYLVAIAVVGASAVAHLRSMLDGDEITPNQSFADTPTLNLTGDEVVGTQGATTHSWTLP